MIETQQKLASVRVKQTNIATDRIMKSVGYKAVNNALPVFI